MYLDGIHSRIHNVPSNARAENFIIVDFVACLFEESKGYNICRCLEPRLKSNPSTRRKIKIVLCKLKETLRIFPFH